MTTRRNKLNFATHSLLLGSLMAGPLVQARVIDHPKEDLEALLGHPAKVTNIYNAQQMGLDHGSSLVQPWSGSEWPDMTGGIVNHYRAHSKQSKLRKGWESTRERLESDIAMVKANVRGWNADQIAKNLSPAEKYDLLLGDLSFTFSTRIVEEIKFRTQAKEVLAVDLTHDVWDPNFNIINFQGHRNKNFIVDSDDQGRACFKEGTSQAAFKVLDRQRGYTYWSTEAGAWFNQDTGINYGWAGASVFLPRPAEKVTVRGATGQMITFFPEDLKALGSYLFYHATQGTTMSMPIHYFGRPCADSEGPAVDDAGWIKDLRCNDLDPGVFHMALINRIGAERAPMVMDIDNTSETRNIPVSRYRFTYFNPRTGIQGSLSQSRISINGFRDAFKSRRSALAQYLVGVKATVTMTGPHVAEEVRDRVTDSKNDDLLYTRTYAYDLEIDSQGNVLGGEWGERFSDEQKGVRLADQPDFIWAGSMDQVPTSPMSGFNTADVWDFVHMPVDPVTQKRSMRPFGNMLWSWNGTGPLPKQWAALARADEKQLLPPLHTKAEVLSMQERNIKLRSPFPYSNIIYYLFDRSSGQIKKRN